MTSPTPSTLLRRGRREVAPAVAAAMAILVFAVSAVATWYALR